MPASRPFRSRVARVALALALVCALGSAPASAHSNHLAVDGQVVADGTVVVENVFNSVDAFVVVRADDGGEPGEPIGAKRLDGTGMHEAVEVPIDDGAFAGGERRLWAVLHADDGDGEFSPADDPALTSFGGLAGDRFAARSGDRGASVVAEGFSFQRADDGEVTVTRAELPRDGHLVLRAADGSDGPGGDGSNGTSGNVTDGGRVVASAALPAGVHEDVPLSLSVAPENLSTDDGTVRLVAQVYGDDGDGEFGADDRPVTVGGTPVGTTFTVATGDDANASSLGPPEVNTPTPGSAPDGEGDERGGFGSGIDAALPALVAFGALVALAGVGALLLARRVR
ncbi:hypothetical protein ACFQPA_11205 [Halomarina halobia]|uniref:DUF7282 domain-containing protein n=1 Tax=Halomarina halobia TaxID=3033386 RepID=A0ABD6ABQ0_9EURY|nr:hypothetical protein [Halomarina sp. PSR21]